MGSCVFMIKQTAAVHLIFVVPYLFCQVKIYTVKLYLHMLKIKMCLVLK